MTAGPARREHLVWLTRGRSWGFRFLLDGGLGDPLRGYEALFADREHEAATWVRSAGRVAVRFPDPPGRRDDAGRVIPHDFIVLGASVDAVTSVDDALTGIWPLVADAYGRVWAAESPPAASDLRF